MNLLIPLLGALLGSGATITEKVLLGAKGITYKNYSTISFIAALFVAGIAFFAISPPVTTDLFFGYSGFLLIFSTLAILTSNLLYYHALKHDQLTEMETIGLLAHIPVILVSYVFFVDERNNSVLIAGLIASTVVIWSHWKKGHSLFKKKTLPFIIWISIIAPLQAAAFKEILAIWNPISLQFVREIIIVPILSYMYASTLKRVPAHSFATIFFTGSIATIGSILFFVSYQKLGILQTTLIFTIQPLLTYVGALLLLKERFDRKKFIAFLIVLASIASVQIK